MAPNPADTVALVAKLLAIFIGAALAEFIAPHIVVLLAGVVGSIFGLMDWRQCTRWEALRYVSGFTMLAWLFSGFAAMLAQYYFKGETAVPFLSPAAAAIGYIGHRWPLFFTWGLRWMARAPRGPQQ